MVRLESVIGVALGVCTVLVGLAKVCVGNIAAQCAQFGVNDIQIYNSGERFGYYTIGAQFFDANWVSSLGARYEFIPRSGGDIHLTFADSAGNLNQEDSPCPWNLRVCTAEQQANSFQLTPDQTCVDPKSMIKFCVGNSEAEIRMYLVKKKGRVLRGWLHVEIEVKSDEMELIYVQMRDEAFNAIGEFVNDNVVPGARCRPTKNYLVSPTEYQFFPCSATGFREAKTSQAIFMAKKEHYKNPAAGNTPYSPQGDLSKGIHFLWKMDEYWCSRHLRIQPFAYILTKANKMRAEGAKPTGLGENTRMWRKIPNHWIYPSWYAASDIIFPDGELDCSTLAINDDDGIVSQDARNSWFTGQSKPVILKEDNWHPTLRYQLTPGGVSYGSRLCQVDPLKKRQIFTVVPVFSGRCQGHFSKEVSYNQAQGCNLDASAEEFKPLDLSTFVTYADYKLAWKMNRQRLCESPCVSPQSALDKELILAFPSGDEDNTPTGTGQTEHATYSAEEEWNNAKIAKLRVGRKYHGALCTLVVMFFMPVSILLSRYYKETFMSSYCCGAPVWFWVHLSTILVTISLFASGHAAIFPAFPVWGRSQSKAGVGHRVCGYLSVTLFLINLFFGGCRAGATVKKETMGMFKLISRLISLIMHSLLGFLHHFLNFAALISSAYIPNSPALHRCNMKGLPVGIGPIVFVTVGFYIFDLVFHILLTILQCCNDRLNNVRRPWWCPIIPFLPINSQVDMRGACLRKILCLVYIFISLVFAVITFLLVLLKEFEKHCKMGPMSCKHPFGCHKLALLYEQWYNESGGDISVLELE